MKNPDMKFGLTWWLNFQLIPKRLRPMFMLIQVDLLFLMLMLLLIVMLMQCVYAHISRIFVSDADACADCDFCI